jgi:hypothetical protein
MAGKLLFDGIAHILAVCHRRVFAEIAIACVPANKGVTR